MTELYSADRPGTCTLTTRCLDSNVTLMWLVFYVRPGCGRALCVVWYSSILLGIQDLDSTLACLCMVEPVVGKADRTLFCRQTCCSVCSVLQVDRVAGRRCTVSGSWSNTRAGYTCRWAICSETRSRRLGRLQTSGRLSIVQCSAEIWLQR